VVLEDKLLLLLLFQVLQAAAGQAEDLEEHLVMVFQAVALAVVEQAVCKVEVA
jgi:hypothetical protein